MELLYKIGQNIKLIRLVRGYSQAGLARKLGKSQNWLQKTEKGEIDIGISQLAEIAFQLEVSPEYIITFDKSKILT